MRNLTLPRLLLLALAAFIVIQLIPYGRAHTNPPVVQEPAWDSPQTQAFFDRACADCHSNKTVWPWYSNIAPVSWLVQHHVEEGRGKLNVSEMGRRNETDEMAKVIRNGEMPPKTYLPMHPNAKLNASEQADFIRGLEQTFGPMKEGSGRDNDEGDK